MPGIRLIAVVFALASLAAAPALAQSNDDIVNQLLGAPGHGAAPATPPPPSAPAVVPAPSGPSEPTRYRHFDTAPPVEDVVNALIPFATVRDLAEIPQGQRRTAGLQVEFPYDSAEITASARAILDRIGPALNDPRLASYRIALNGHTDAHGSAGYNLDLSRRRATAVETYLARYHGIAPSRLETRGYGESSPRFRPATDGRNRRVEVQAAGR